MLQLSTNSKKETVVNIILIQYGNLKLNEWPIPCVAIYSNATVSKQAHLFPKIKTLCKKFERKALGATCILGLTHIRCSFEQP